VLPAWKDLKFPLILKTIGGVQPRSCKSGSFSNALFKRYTPIRSMNSFTPNNPKKHNVRN